MLTAKWRIPCVKSISCKTYHIHHLSLNVSFLHEWEIITVTFSHSTTQNRKPILPHKIIIFTLQLKSVDMLQNVKLCVDECEVTCNLNNKSEIYWKLVMSDLQLLTNHKLQNNLKKKVHLINIYNHILQKYSWLVEEFSHLWCQPHFQFLQNVLCYEACMLSETFAGLRNIPIIWEIPQAS